MKIGFVDYYIAEWHANNYPAWFAAASKELGADGEIAADIQIHDDSSRICPLSTKMRFPIFVMRSGSQQVIST